MTELMTDKDFLEAIREILKVKAGLYLIAEDLFEGLREEAKKAVMV